MSGKHVRGIILIMVLLGGCSTRTQESGPPASAEVAKSLPDRLESSADLRSSDGRLHVNNRFNDGGGTMADYTVTFDWADGGEQRQRVRESAKDSQGWVESIGVLKTSAGPVYVVVAEGRWAMTEYTIHLYAYRIKEGAKELEPVEGFFPAIPGTSEDGCAIRWEHWRTRGPEIFPRPFEVRIDEKHHCLRVWVLPKAALDIHPSARDMANGRVLTLSLRGDKLVCPDFGEADEEAITKACDMHRM